LSGLFGGDFTALDHIEDFVGREGSLLVAEEFVHEVEFFADGGIGDAERFFDLADIAAAAEEGHDEILQIEGETEEGRDRETCVNLSFAAGAEEFSDEEFAAAKGAT